MHKIDWFGEYPAPRRTHLTSSIGPKLWSWFFLMSTQFDFGATVGHASLRFQSLLVY
jgi:hypothetical protein